VFLRTFVIYFLARPFLGRLRLCHPSVNFLMTRFAHAEIASKQIRECKIYRRYIARRLYVRAHCDHIVTVIVIRVYSRDFRLAIILPVDFSLCYHNTIPTTYLCVTLKMNYFYTRWSIILCKYIYIITRINVTCASYSMASVRPNFSLKIFFYWQFRVFTYHQAFSTFTFITWTV
jgi:hypothetical protein